jgi:alcohol dehydrogenase
MKAAQINSYGGRDALKINGDVPKPLIADDQILVKVHAAGVNPFDYKVREGMMRQVAELTFPATLGGDVAGTVEEIGSTVTDFAVGQAVYGMAGALSGSGSFAEYVPVKASSVALKPSATDFIVSAALPLASVSAYQALVDNMHLQAGQKILIHGGAGGIGLVAIQLAKHLGAYVATTVSEADIEYAKRLGADEVIDYNHQDFSGIVKDYNAVFDMVGGEANAKSYNVLVSGGRFVSMVEKVNQELADQLNINYILEFTRVDNENLKKIAELVDKGVLGINVDKVFPIEEAAAALEYVKTGHPRGKVVIRLAD